MKSNRSSLFLLAAQGKLHNFFGAEGDNPDGGAGTGNRAEEGQGSTDSGVAESGQSGDPQAKIKALSEEKDRHYSARTKAEQERDSLAAKLKEFEDAGKTETEKVTAERDALKAEVAALRQEVQQSKLRNAFLTSNDVQWHNPERALALVDLSTVEIGKDGEPDRGQLKAAIKALAESDSYLVKSSEQPTRQPAPSSPSGSQPARKNTNGELDRAALAAKYPALRQHI